MAFFGGVPIGNVGPQGADISPYLRMVGMQQQQDQFAQSMQQAMQDRAFQEEIALSQMEFDRMSQQQAGTRRDKEFSAGIEQAGLDRASQERVAMERARLGTRGRGGAEGGLTEMQRAQLEYLQENISLWEAGLLVTDDPDRKQELRDQIDGARKQIAGILGIADEGDKASVGTAVEPELEPEPETEPEVPPLPYDKYLPGPKPPDSPPQYKKQPEAKGPEAAEPKEPKYQHIREAEQGEGVAGPPAGPMYPDKTEDYPEKKMAYLEVRNTLNDQQVEAAKTAADTITKEHHGISDVMEFLRSVPGALELYNWWLAGGRVGVPSEMNSMH